MARRAYSRLFRIGMPLLGTFYYIYIRPQMLKAGTLPGEAERQLPGDDLIASPNFQVTHAIDIAAPPEMVWPWIAQIGRDGSGFYGLDGITNQGVPSVAYLRQDLPAPQSGETMDSGFRIISVEPEHLLLYGSFELPTIAGEIMERTTLLLLERKGNNTRLLLRRRGYTYGLFGPMLNLCYEVFDFFLSSGQLQAIRQRAETLARLRPAVG